MGTFLTIMTNLILTRKIEKSKLLAWIDATDVDKDGYISVKEALDSIATAIARYGVKE